MPFCTTLVSFVLGDGVNADIDDDIENLLTSIWLTMIWIIQIQILKINVLIILSVENMILVMILKTNLILVIRNIIYISNDAHHDLSEDVKEYVNMKILLTIKATMTSSVREQSICVKL